MQSLVGHSVSHYQIVEKLGEGGMGVVYKAHDTHLDRFVALKFLPSHLTSDVEAKDRFMHEAKAASALQHANICVIHDFDNTPEGQLFIVMEHLDGKTLKDNLENGPLDGDRAVDIAFQVGRGLAKAHQHAIVHRDIKPANVMLTADGVAKIVDFGLAKLGGRTMLTLAGSTLGTVAYMSPEQARGGTADSRTDIWSLGVMLFEMLTGHLPFRGEHETAMMYSIINEDPASIRSFLPDIARSIDELLSRCLQKDPSARYQSMEQVVEALGEIKRAASVPPGFTKRGKTSWLKKPQIALALLLLLLGLGIGAYWLIDRNARTAWARGEGITEVVRLVDQEQYFQAFTLAQQVASYAPDDPLLLKTWPRFTRYVSITSEPAGARVHMKDYQSTDPDWVSLGATPLSGIVVPRGFLRLKIEKEGYPEIQGALLTRWGDSSHFVLDQAGVLPDGMVHIPGGSFALNLSGLEQVDSIELGDYLIDKYEVTNLEYKRFVDGGGYQKQDFWKEPFLKNGMPVSWDEAMREFRDKTGRPGPSTWEVGNYPEGQADFPVAGISWYEAAAYAEFAGKSLPTIFHWNRAAVPLASSYIVPMSNFSEKGLDSAGANKGMGVYGTFDMAGNVREWCWNADRGERFILGGGWNDQTYMFTDAYTQRSFDRSQSNGVRCVKYLDPEEKNLALAMGPITRPFRDFLKERPVSDAVFKYFLGLFAYDKTDLKSVVESSDTTEEWIKQKITFDAAYGNERVTAFLFLPLGGTPPYQTVVYFPGSNAILDRSSTALQTGAIDFVIKSGRAVLYPIYKGTYERNSGITTDQPSMTNAYKDWIIQIAKDLSRSLDYLETRTDIDKEKLAYYGLSWGGRLGVLLIAVERRFKASVHYVAGLKFQRSLPEADPVNYASRVKTPVLMLNGRHDNFFPLETSQIPLYKMLGTPTQQKRHVVYETGHFVPRIQLIKEVLDWLDQYLGPVQISTPL